MNNERRQRIHRAAMMKREHNLRGGMVAAEKRELLDDRSAEIERLMKKRKDHGDYLWPNPKEGRDER